MGLGSSQVRFLALTDRDHNISRELQGLANQKVSLARDMQGVTRDYQKALCSKVMKWSNNSGVSYSDITYSTLMYPNAVNQKSPIMITDSCGRIVLDDKYAKYAEKLDANGGKWEGDVRYEILAALTGISVDDIKAQDAAVKTAGTAADEYEKLREDYDKWLSKEDSAGGAESLTVEKLAKKLGTVNGTDLSKLYSNGEYAISSEADLKSLAEGIKNSMSNYFVDDADYLGVSDKKAFNDACDAFVAYYSSLMTATTSNADQLRKNDGLNGIFGFYKLNFKQAFEFIMGAYSGSKGKKDATGNKTYIFRDTTSAKWQDWYAGVKSRKEAMDAAKKDYVDAADTANQAMTADQESNIKYYDLLFQSIADNGWTYDTDITDADYLNQTFQNNRYTITTISENSCYDENQEPSSRNCKFYYDTSLASDFKNIFMVNDSEIREQALVDYEYKKGVISAKESRIDQRMKNLETEQASVKKMMESITKVKEDNIERTMNLWG